MAIRILIADDHGVLRAGLRALLSAEPDLVVEGEAATSAEAIQRARELRPDVALLDISMASPDGLELIGRLRELDPPPRVLILTAHEDESLLQACLRAGAAGYIVERAAGTELIDAVRAVSQGHVYIHPTMLRSLLKSAREAPQPAGSAAEPLTPRELEVLRLLTLGHTNRQIADLWTISVRTVESHRASLMGKLNLHSRAELVRYALEHGLVAQPFIAAPRRGTVPAGRRAL